MFVLTGYQAYSQGYRSGTINNKPTPVSTPPPNPLSSGSSPGYIGYPVFQGDGGKSKLAEQYVKAALAYEEAARRTKCTENRIFIQLRLPTTDVWPINYVLALLPNALNQLNNSPTVRPMINHLLPLANARKRNQVNRTRRFSNG
nr:hypothetical protein [Spirosoma sp. KNUC1025]